jgi:hypothetical protein
MESLQFMEPNDDLAKINAECSKGYHKVDDFRGKLLGFLPLASGIGVFGSLYVELKKESANEISKNYIALGVFGVLVTLGLLIYELKGITKCMQFIFLGKWIESRMKTNKQTVPEAKFQKVTQGYFTELAGKRTILEPIVTKPVASAIIYSTVIGAWTYVLLLRAVN